MSTLAPLCVLGLKKYLILVIMEIIQLRIKYANMEIKTFQKGE
jgi:hypothetical protein